MKLLTDEEICEWIEWSHYALQGIEWSTPEGENFLRTPDFSTEQPWFDYVFPALGEKLYGVCISSDIHVTYWFVQFYPNAIDTFEGREPKLPDACREALTKLVGG